VGNPFAVDTSYIASVKAVHEILKSISTPNDRWWVEGETKKYITIAYDPEAGARMPGINIITFQFPKVFHLPFPAHDGEMVCLHWGARIEGKQGLYVDGSRIVNDDINDWEKFWPAFKAGLEEMKESLKLQYSLDEMI
jgi:hypothetical protein